MTQQRSTVDSRRRLTNYKMPVSQLTSCSSLETVRLTTVNLNVKLSVQSVLRNMSTVCWGCCQNQ